MTAVELSTSFPGRGALLVELPVILLPMLH